MPAGKWYVLKNIPTYFEIGAHNAVELYEWDETKKRVQVTFEYRKGAADGPKATLLQHGWVKDTEKGTTWAVCACLAPHCTRSHCTRSHCIC
jgi:hypothetical protein